MNDSATADAVRTDAGRFAARQLVAVGIGSGLLGSLALAVPIALKVFPGNVIAASVSVTGTTVQLQVRNLTRKTRFSKSLRAAALDVSSAEWVAEAPSACDQRGRCTVLPLTDFGTVPFANASATANGHTGSIVDDGWTATPLELVPNARRFVTATAPSALSADGTVFSVTFRTG